MFMKDFTRPALGFSAVETLLAPVTSGLVAGTLVETAAGWQPVEALQPGDALHTLDGGLARILRLDCRSMQPAPETTLILVKGGTFDTCSDMVLVAGQHLLIDTLDDPAMNGAPFALVPARALLGCDGVQRRSLTAPIRIITPIFADEEVIYANSGALIHCPGLVDGAQSYPENSFFPVLDTTTARAFLNRRARRLA